VRQPIVSPFKLSEAGTTSPAATVTITRGLPKRPAYGT
jgi:hypothetical protein